MHLRRAMEMARRDPARAEQFDEKLRDEPWTEVVEFAAYCCQIKALGLRHWQEPPCVVDQDDPNERNKEAQAMLRTMLQAGVSRYDPDPLQALKGRRRMSK